MKIAVVLGTRPEIIKLAPVIRSLEIEKLDYFLVNSGQHYSSNMSRAFFSQLALPRAKYDLAVGSGTHAEETGRILVGVERVLASESPDVVLVEGDTNTVLASALAASKLMIRIGHVEAGLRSFDENMPEEANRVVTDHLSRYLFAPTVQAKRNLLREGLRIDRIHVTGNTIVDAIKLYISSARKTLILNKLGLAANGYFLLTLHRQENVDSPRKLIRIIKGVRQVARKFGIPVIFPVHPRTTKQLRRRRVSFRSSQINPIEPLDYFNFLHLAEKARVILTDSGGVQEEACALRVPCVTLRDNTERPETLQVGANVLAGSEPAGIVARVSAMAQMLPTWRNPYGDGRASERIARVLATEH